MSTITKKDFVDRISEKTGQKRGEVKETIQLFLDEMIDELTNGNRLEFRDFGVFEVRERAARIAQNPKTLEQVQVPARKAVRFKIGRLMRIIDSQTRRIDQLTQRCFIANRFRVLACKLRAWHSLGKLHEIIQTTNRIKHLPIR